MTPFEHQQKVKSQIFGSYNNTASFVKSKEEKPLENGEKKEAPASVNTDESKKEENAAGKEEANEGKDKEQEEGK
jgi:hypothetical protein